MSQETNSQEKATQQLFIVGGDLLQAIANYLGTRPYAEVSLMIDALKKAQPVSVKPEGEVEVQEKDAAPALKKVEE